MEYTMWHTIQDMAQLYNTYRLVRVIDKRAKAIEKENPQGRNQVDGSYIIATPHIAMVRKIYKKRRKSLLKISSRSAQLAFGLAEEEKYVERTMGTESGLQVRAYKLTTKGWKLIERSCFGLLPKGLWLAWAEKNNKFYNLLIGFIGGVIVGCIGIAISILEFKKS